MSLLFGIVMFVFVIVCLLLCLLILIQSDKGGGISATLGGGFAGANALLGTQDTANILTRGTSIFAGVYISLCIVLTIIVANMNVAHMEQKSVLKQRAEKTPASILDNATMPMMGGDQGAAQSPGMPDPTQSQQGTPDAAGSQPIPMGAAPAGSAGK
jgi:preprotein translocase subunit SecG